MSIDQDPLHSSEKREPLGPKVGVQNEVRLSLGRWFFLGIISLALCTFLPLVLFAPVPLVMIFLLYGRSKGLTMGFLTMALIMLGALKFPAVLATGGIYLMAMVYGAIIAEVICRGIHPVKGLLVGGFSILLVVSIGALMVAALSDFSLTLEMEKIMLAYAEQIKTTQSEVLSQGGAEADMIREFVSNPKKIVAEALQWLPAGLFGSIFFCLWASFFVVLRNSLIWENSQKYPYRLQDFISFKVPDFFVFLVIAGLVLTLAGEWIMGPLGPVIGGNLLFCISVFYFFQGLGIFLDFLTYLKLKGFMRTLLILVGIFIAWRVIVLMGVFDLWVNFRKFFKKNKIENREGE